MVLDWLSGSKATVSDLILKKRYAQAAERIATELKNNRRNERLRLQLAHVRALAGDRDAAIRVLDSLAGDLARDGFVTKAIAVLKKIQRIDPDRSGVDARLAALVGGQAPAVAGAWVDARPDLEIALEIGQSPPVLAAGADRPPAKARDARGAEGAGGAFGTPLFQGMSREETLAVIRELRLFSAGPGEILVTEGEPGQSLFVLTTGVCRAYVRGPQGRNVEVRQLREGDFFGEISVLTGQLRSATITTVTPCELLELDRPSLDAIIRAHPNVRKVLEEFHAQRADSTLEAAIRGMKR
jgi:hypothetical protein